MQTPSDSIEPIGESSLLSGLVSCSACSGVSTSARFSGSPVQPPLCMLVYGGSKVYLAFCNSVSLYSALSVMAIPGTRPDDYIKALYTLGLQVSIFARLLSTGGTWRTVTKSNNNKHSQTASWALLHCWSVTHWIRTHSNDLHSVPSCIFKVIFLFPNRKPYGSIKRTRGEQQTTRARLPDADLEYAFVQGSPWVLLLSGA